MYQVPHGTYRIQLEVFLKDTQQYCMPVILVSIYVHAVEAKISCVNMYRKPSQKRVCGMCIIYTYDQKHLPNFFTSLRAISPINYRKVGGVRNYYSNNQGEIIRDAWGLLLGVVQSFCS